MFYPIRVLESKTVSQGWFCLFSVCYLRLEREQILKLGAFRTWQQIRYNVLRIQSQSFQKIKLKKWLGESWQNGIEVKECGVLSWDIYDVSKPLPQELLEWTPYMCLQTEGRGRNLTGAREHGSAEAFLRPCLGVYIVTANSVFKPAR